MEYLLSIFPVLPFDLEAARIHAELWAALQRGGQIIGAHDLLIAATARVAGYGVITANSAEFHTFSGLEVINRWRDLDRAERRWRYMKAAEFDQKFDDAESVLDVLDLASARKPNLAQKKVNVDFPV